MTSRSVVHFNVVRSRHLVGTNRVSGHEVGDGSRKGRSPNYVRDGGRGSRHEKVNSRPPGRRGHFVVATSLCDIVKKLHVSIKISETLVKDSDYPFQFYLPAT